MFQRQEQCSLSFLHPKPAEILFLFLQWLPQDFQCTPLICHSLISKIVILCRVKELHQCTSIYPLSLFAIVVTHFTSTYYKPQNIFALSSQFLREISLNEKKSYIYQILIYTFLYSCMQTQISTQYGISIKFCLNKFL